MDGAKYPKLEGKRCKGFDLSKMNPESIRTVKSLNLNYLIDFYKNFADKENFFLKNSFFEKLAGSDQLREQVIAGLSEQEIKKSWQPALEKFKKTRAKYLLYEDGTY